MILEQIGRRPEKVVGLRFTANSEKVKLMAQFSLRVFAVIGGMAEWLKAAVLKTAGGASSPWVRILLPPLI